MEWVQLVKERRSEYVVHISSLCVCLLEAASHWVAGELLLRRASVTQSWPHALQQNLFHFTEYKTDSINLLPWSYFSAHQYDISV